MYDVIVVGAGPTNQNQLWTIQQDIILELAERGSCVIVGRCADFILREKAVNRITSKSVCWENCHKRFLNI